MDTDIELNNEEGHLNNHIRDLIQDDTIECSVEIPKDHTPRSDSDEHADQDANEISLSNHDEEKPHNFSEELTGEIETLNGFEQEDENVPFSNKLETFDMEVMEGDSVSTEQNQESLPEMEKSDVHVKEEDESSLNKISPEHSFDALNESEDDNLPNCNSFSSHNTEIHHQEENETAVSEDVPESHEKENDHLQSSTPLPSDVPDDTASSPVDEENNIPSDVSLPNDSDGSLRGEDAIETIHEHSHDNSSLPNGDEAEDNEINASLPMDSAYVEGSTMAQLPPSDTLMSFSKQSFGSDEDILDENENHAEEDNSQNGFSSSTLELQKKYATWDGRNETKCSEEQNETNGELISQNSEKHRVRRRSHDNAVESPRISVMPFALSQSFHMDFNTQLRDMDEALKRAESVQKKVVDDDDKFPDSVTPIKVEHSLRDSGYDIPFIDDEAFYYQDWYVTEDHRWSRLEPSPHWMHSKSRFSGIAEPEILTATSSPQRSAPTPTKTMSAQSPVRESISNRQFPPPKSKKGLFSFFGCVSRTAT